jgi:hypothetical protein
MKAAPFLIAAVLLSACAGTGGPAAPPVPLALDPAQCDARIAESERYLRAVASPEDELRTSPWVAVNLAEVRGRCPGRADTDAVLLRLANAAFFTGQFWLARQAYAELSARFPDSGFNFEDIGGRRARLLDACEADVGGLDAYRLALLDARHGRPESARRRLARVAGSACEALRAAGQDLAAGLRG